MYIRCSLSELNHNRIERKAHDKGLLQVHGEGTKFLLSTHSRPVNVRAVTFGNIGEEREGGRG